MERIIKEIVEKKKEKVRQLGFALGHKIPLKREIPVNQLPLDKPIIIAEIKRKSPAKGVLDKNLNPISLAKQYLDSGVSAISVLCEEDYFNGSLEDLINLRTKFPHAILLRKDFILFKEEIEISYLAGADMVLLIASVFMGDSALFSDMLHLCKKFGILPLVEIHDENELHFVSQFQVQLLGINSRDLRDFTIDKIATLRLKAKIPSHIRVIFESGIHSPFDAYLASSCGFGGILCGEYLIKSQDRQKVIQDLRCSLESGARELREGGFYKRFFATFKQPIVKICGVTNKEDTRLVEQSGADMIGFILSQSVRQISPQKLREIALGLENILKIAVVLENKADLEMAIELLESRVIDAIQLHNTQCSDTYAGYRLKYMNLAFYSSFNIGEIGDIPTHYVSPFALFDSKSEAKGGSGKMIEREILATLREKNKYLALSGGINIDNIDYFLSLKPMMLDICSGVESDKGKKDSHKLSQLMGRIRGEMIGFMGIYFF